MDGSDRPPPPISAADVAALIALQLVAELHAALCPGAEAGEVLGRAREMVEDWRRLARLMSAPGTPFDADAEPALADLGALLDRSAPLLARIRRIPMPPASGEPGPAQAA